MRHVHEPRVVTQLNRRLPRTHQILAQTKLRKHRRKLHLRLLRGSRQWSYTVDTNQPAVAFAADVRADACGRTVPVDGFAAPPRGGPRAVFELDAGNVPDGA